MHRLDCRRGAERDVRKGPGSSWVEQDANRWSQPRVPSRESCPFLNCGPRLDARLLALHESTLDMREALQ